ncbi:uncharacterized protein CBL_10932 [Carabus blaptoides fortunei]
MQAHTDNQPSLINNVNSDELSAETEYEDDFIDYYQSTRNFNRNSEEFVESWPKELFGISEQTETTIDESINAADIVDKNNTNVENNKTTFEKMSQNEKEMLLALRKSLNLGRTNVQSSMVPPQFMSDLYQAVTDLESGITIRNYPHGSSEVSSILETNPNVPGLFHFDVSGMKYEVLMDAELHVYRIGIDASASINNQPYYLLRVYQVMPTNKHSLSLNPDVHQLLNVHYVSAFGTGWQVFKVKRAVEAWKNGTNPNLGLLVTATTILNEPVEIRFSRKHEYVDKFQPTLILFTNSMSHGKNITDYNESINTTRTQMNRPDSLQVSSTKQCNISSLYIDFKKLGWSEFIVSPVGFEAYQCLGECDWPTAAEYNSTNHAILIKKGITKALLYGPILRKDQRIEFDTCAAIYKEKYMEELDKNLVNPCELDAKVRSQAVLVLLHVLQHSSNRSEIMQSLWHIMKERYEVFRGKRYFGNSQIHFLKLRVLQTFHLLVNHLNTDYMYLSTKWLLECLVNESEQPSIKLLIQWALMRINLRNESFLANELMPVLKQSKGTSCTSLFPLMYHAVKSGDVQMHIVEDCMNCLLTYTMGQHFNIRYYAQETIKRIYEIYETKEDFKKLYSPIYKTVCAVIDQTSSDKSFDMALTYKDLTFSLRTIYYDIPRLTNITHSEWIPVEYFNSLQSAIDVRSSDNSLEQLVTPTRKPTITTSNTIDYSSNVQQKLDLFTSTNIGHISEVTTPNANLIVVASLIDRAPNLGGLSRTCEVFRVKQYVLNNAQVVKNKDYQSLSMSSEKWVDTLEVKVENLAAYLKDMKKKGYEIVGAEHTVESVCLDIYRFQKNTVLLLGNEKEGIPPNLIHLLDECIEIPQFGQIRSLNVHVAGALFIWEYAKQHCNSI